MPGTVRSASVSVTEPVSCSTSAGITVTDLGVSSSGAVNLPLEASSVLKPLLPVTVWVGRVAVTESFLVSATAGVAATAKLMAPVRYPTTECSARLRSVCAACMAWCPLP